MANPIRSVLLDLGDTLLDESLGWYERDPILPGVRETLPKLSRRYRLGILSNTVSTGREDMAIHLERYGIASCFQAIVTSTDLGWRKPHPLIFEAAVSALRADPATTAMVGNDLPVDIAGAKGFGLRTVHFRWSPRYRHEPASPLEEATTVIRRFEELPAALRRLETLAAPPRTAFVDESTLFRDPEEPKEETNHAV
jgi:HAD superfamily hydrolase (TIGR01509 family)